MRLSRAIVTGIVLWATSAAAQAQYPFLDPSLTVDARVADLVSRLTLEQKITQLGHSAPAIPELGIAAYNYWNEGLHGVANEQATSFPQPIAMSSTWDPELVYAVATAISDEARVLNRRTGNPKGLTYWSPVLNMARDPRWGRQAENFGEDPHLASRLGVSFIRGMQGSDPKYLKTVATAKHFACNSQEDGRNSTSANVDERSLREYYLRPFRAAVTEANVQSVMSAYNAVNEIPSPASVDLLQRILREEWGFDGLVVSDCDAVSDVYASHGYVASVQDAVTASINAGTDLNCGLMYQEHAGDAVDEGLLSEAAIDIALKRIFRARFLLGEFDPPSMVPYTTINEAVRDGQANKDLALRAAREAIVLLKNQSSALPLERASVNRVAVIGPNADVVRLGEYSGNPTILTSPLAGIETAMQSKIHAEIYQEQNGVLTETCSEGGSDLGWIHHGDYAAYHAIDFSASPTYFEARVASDSSGGAIEVHLDDLDGALIGTCAVSGTGGWQNWTTVTCPVSHTSAVHDVFLKFTGGSGYLLNLAWFRFGPPTKTVSYAQGTTIDGAWNTDLASKATSLAGQSDVAIVVGGTDGFTDAREGHDRASLDLPGVQTALIQAVYSANPRTILVLVNGSSSAVNWEQATVPGIVAAFFDGQSQGRAIADVLFGAYNPGGKLTTTWYKTAADQPPMTDYDVKNGRTYMYFTGTPLYPFGHGLSYTSFAYSNLRTSKPTLAPGQTISVTVDVRNTGTLAGDEVAQLYIRDLASSLKRPLRELKEFRRLNLAPGQTRTITFALPYEELSHWDTVSRTFEVEDGTFEIMVGSSSADIRARGSVLAQGGVKGAYAQIEAEHFDGTTGSIVAEACGEGGQNLGYIQNGNYALYRNVDFGNGAAGFEARVAAVAPSGGAIELHMDSPTGPLAGTLPIAVTSGWQSYSTRTCSVSGAHGRRDLYLVFKAATNAPYVGNLNWFRFVPAASFEPDAYYRLINRTSQMALDNGGTGREGPTIVQRTISTTVSTDQEWQIVPLGNGYWKLVNHTSNKCLDSVGDAENGGEVWQRTDEAVVNTSQQWLISSLGNGDFKLVSRSTGKCLDDRQGSTTSGTLIWQWEDQASTNTNQQWKIVKVR